MVLASVGFPSLPFSAMTRKELDQVQPSRLRQDTRRQYLLVECGPPRFPRLNRLRRVMNLEGYIGRIAERTSISTVLSASNNNRPGMANVVERSGRPEVTSPTARPCSPSDPSHCGEQFKKPKSEATRPTQSTDVPHSPPPPPPAPGPGSSSVAYASDSRSAGFYRLGSGVEHLHGRGSVLSQHGRACWLNTLSGFARDVLELLKEAFRGRPDPFADLRGRGPIIVTVETKTTITAVRSH